MSDRPLLMIPGPIEVSPRVVAAASVPPPSHVAPGFIATFGHALAAMRQVWRAGPDAQPFVLAGSGTLAMEQSVCNLLDPGDTALVVNTGYFSDRMATMLGRRGVSVVEVGAPLGEAPDAPQVAAVLAENEGVKAVFGTHVDTSTGVRLDAEGVARAANAAGALVVLDGVCATAAERLEMAAWGVDVYLTASQKAIGAPAGLALMVASRRALDARGRLSTPPPLSLDWEPWTPIMEAYEAGRPSYFATPATTLVPALAASLDEILEADADPEVAMDACFARHARVAAALRAAWAVLGLRLVPARPELAANTLSALWYPEGVGPDLPGRVAARGVVVAGGLHPEIKARYFRVGHMGHVTTRPEDLRRTVRAVGEALVEAGHAADVEGAVAALG